jgi:hypothetical protein
MKRFAALCAVIALCAAPALADPKGDEVARIYFSLPKPSDTRAVATMTIVAKSLSRKVRKLEMLTREGPRGRDSLVRFLEPADVAGTKFLTLAKEGGGSEQRLYLPALKKTRKIASSAKDGAFVNSDLSFYDMEPRSFDDCAYVLLSESEAAPDEALAGKRFYRLEMRPKDPEAPYSRMVAWVCMDDGDIYRLECFDRRDGGLVKVIVFERIELIKGSLIATRTKVSDLRKGSTTVMALGELMVDEGVKDEAFSLKSLEG